MAIEPRLAEGHDLGARGQLRRRGPNRRARPGRCSWAECRRRRTRRRALAARSTTAALEAAVTPTATIVSTPAASARCDHRLAIGVELFLVQMGVRVDQRHGDNSPAGAIAGSRRWRYASRHGFGHELQAWRLAWPALPAFPGARAAAPRASSARAAACAVACKSATHCSDRGDVVLLALRPACRSGSRATGRACREIDRVLAHLDRPVVIENVVGDPLGQLLLVGDDLLAASRRPSRRPGGSRGRRRSGTSAANDRRSSAAD